MYENVYGLTCIENHVIAFLRENSIDESYFYYDSMISLSDLFDDIINKKESVFDYSGTEKVQNICKTMNIIKLNRVFSPVLYLPASGETILVHISTDFSKTILNSRAFREDHYVSVKKHDETRVTVTNDIPAKTVVIEADCFKQAFEGDYFLLSVCGSLSEKDKQTLLSKGYDKYTKVKSCCGIFTPDNAAISDSRSFRDLIYLLKMLRVRFSIFLSNFGIRIGLCEIIRQYEKCLLQMDYSLLRKLEMHSVQHEIAQKLCEIEISYYREVEGIFDECKRNCF